MTCLDVTITAIEEAIKNSCELIVSHHPLLFSPISSITEDSLAGQKVLMLLKAGISLLSLHTRFDGAPGGLNERFAKKIGVFPTQSGSLLKEEPFIGGLGVLPCKISPELFAKQVADSLGAPVKLYSAGFDLERIGYCCGSGKDLVFPCLDADMDAFVGGDISYHVAQEAVERGMTIVDCGHHSSEKDAANYLKEDLNSFSNDLIVFAFQEGIGGEMVDFL
jgi:dinuclear metal center YbgI/SA1388 family protein